MIEMKTLFYHGTILTMSDPLYVEAMLIEDNRIKKVGTKKEVWLYVDKNTNLIDLKGKTLMPSFIDSHSHISALATSLSLISLKDVTSFQELIDTLSVSIQDLPEGNWLIGYGYDHNQFKEKKHPTKEILDQISEEIPIMISHQSGHMGVLNSKALSFSPYKDHPTGYLEETDFFKASSYRSQLDDETKIELLLQAQQIYLSYGLTTVQDGLTKKEDLSLLKLATRKKQWCIDVICYLDRNETLKIDDNQYHHHLRLGGYKVILDGSPQGKTAFLTKPYENSNDFGILNYSDPELFALVQKTLDEKQQLLAHCNGDGACKQLLNIYEKAAFAHFNFYRPVMIHSQLIQKSQLKQLKRFHMIPSYFIAHTYYWGDVHIKNLKDRAYHISPLASTIKEHLIFTLHQDSPVLLPNVFEMIWCACTRKTKNGVILGKEERISVFDALKAVTIYGAYQYFEEQEKGSLEEGKLADFIILDKNPLDIDIEELKTIQILKTYKDGKCVFSL